MGHEFRAARLGEVIDIIDGLDHTQSKGFLPDPVGDIGREARVLRARQPAGELVAQLGGGLGVDVIYRQGFLTLTPGNQCRGHGIAGLGVLVLIILREGQLLLLAIFEAEGVHIRDLGRGGLREAGVAFDRFLDGAEDGFVFPVGGSEERRHLVEVALGPFGQRMVVALGAGHIGAQEGGHEVRDAVQGHLGVEEHETGGAVVAEATVRGDHLGDQLIPRSAGGEACLEPILEAERRDALGEGILDAQKVRHPVEHLHGVTRRVEQFIDQLGSLVRRIAGQERGRFRGGRHATGGVEVDATQELLIG